MYVSSFACPHPLSLVKTACEASSGVAQWLACWAHNPKVPGSKPGFAMSCPCLAYVLTMSCLCLGLCLAYVFPVTSLCLPYVFPMSVFPMSVFLISSLGLPRLPQSAVNETLLTTELPQQKNVGGCKTPGSRNFLGPHVGDGRGLGAARRIRVLSGDVYVGGCSPSLPAKIIPTKIP